LRQPNNQVVMLGCYNQVVARLFLGYKKLGFEIVTTLPPPCLGRYKVATTL